MRGVLKTQIGLAALAFAAGLLAGTAGAETNQPGTGPVCQALFARAHWQPSPAPATQGAQASQSPVEAALAALTGDPETARIAALEAAIHDTAVLAPREVYDGLWSVPDSAGRIVTRGSGADLQVLVTVMTSEAALERFYKPGAKRKTPPGAPRVWVTLAPEVRDWCRANTDWPNRDAKSQAAAALRVMQLLGIPPGAGYSRFAEAWVSASDLLRPCMDSQIDDHHCNLSFRPDSPSAPEASADYMCWFLGNASASYRPDGAPWTRLGYTYDYGPRDDYGESDVPYGASEFMLGPKATYEVTANFTMAEYCAE